MGILNLLDRWARGSRQLEHLLRVFFVLLLDDFRVGFATVFLLLLNLSEALLEDVMGHRVGDNVLLDGLRLWDLLGLGLRQVERLLYRYLFHACLVKGRRSS